jgi:DNA-binding CsgD family transcriptional regulator
MNRILNALRTPSAMLAALVLALIAQLEHTAQVFMQVVSATGDGAQVHAYAFAIAVETAVLLFVLHGHKRISYGFAIATFATNLSYYAMHGVDLTSIAGAPAWLMAGLLPAAIVGYSHTIADAPPVATPAQPQTEPGRGRWRFWQKPAETHTTSTATTTPVASPVARPVGTLGHPGEWVITTETPVQDTAPTIDKRTQALQLRDEGYTAAEIATMLDAKYSTVQSWLRRANAQTNGVHQ